MAFFEFSLFAANKCAYSIRFDSCIRTSSARNRLLKKRPSSRNILRRLFSHSNHISLQC